MKKNRFAVSFLFLVFVSLEVQAAPFACFTEKQEVFAMKTIDQEEVLSEVLERAYPPDFEIQTLQCRTRSHLGLGLKAVSLSFQAGAFYLACTGLGAPVSLYIQGGALGVGFLSMIVGELPCEDNETEENVKNLAKEVVCRTLEQSGIECKL